MKKNFLNFLNIKTNQASYQDIAQQLREGSEIKGHKMIILVLAMFIASIGLNMNSTAVIIGAMLISPLMGPIMGIGYGMAVYDSKISKQSLKRLLIQVLICILASTLYFFISPINGASNELLARTEPTIWDVLIAIFGGFAGVIGQTRKEYGNVIPGVSIATALMPPLCTVGFGLAQGNMSIALGAGYLFFINSFFICLTTFIVLKVIKMPAESSESIKVHHRNQLVVLIIGVLVTIPSVYTAYQTVIKHAQEREIQSFIQETFNTPDRQALSFTINRDDNQVEIVSIGRPVKEETKKDLEKDLSTLEDFSNYKLVLVQNNVSSLARTSDNDSVGGASQQQIALGSTEGKDKKRWQTMAKLYQPAYNSLIENKDLLSQLEKSMPILFPQVTSVEGSSIDDIDDQGQLNHKKMVIVVYVNQRISFEEAGKMQNWLESETSLPVLLSIRLNTNLEGSKILGDGISY